MSLNTEFEVNLAVPPQAINLRNSEVNQGVLLIEEKKNLRQSLYTLRLSQEVLPNTKCEMNLECPLSGEKCLRNLKGSKKRDFVENNKIS